MNSSNDPIVSCPYDPNHTMLQSKLLWHITGRCQKKKTDGHLYSTCPHNALHIFKKRDIDQHIRDCPDKGPENNDLGITDDDLSAAIRKQFGSKNKEEETSRINEKNKQVPGFDNSEEISEEQKKQKKRTRNKKKPQPQAKMSPEMHEWYEKSYGAHAQKLNPKNNADDDEIDFAKEFEETEAAAQQSKEKSKATENTMYEDSESDISIVSSITITSKNTTRSNITAP